MSRIKWSWIGMVVLLTGATGYGQPVADVFPDAKKVYEIKEFTKGDRVSVGSDGRLLRWKETSGKEQQFQFVDRGNGKWAIKSLKDGQFLSVGGFGRLGVAAEKREAAQEFKIEKTTGKKFNLRESTKNEYVAVGGTGEILRWSKSNKDDQVFEWIEVTAGVVAKPAAPVKEEGTLFLPDSKATYRIVECTKGELLTFGMQQGERVLRWKDFGEAQKANQLWQFEPVQGKEAATHCFIKTVGGRYMAVQDRGGVSAGTAVTNYPKYSAMFAFSVYEIPDATALKYVPDEYKAKIRTTAAKDRPFKVVRIQEMTRMERLAIGSNGNAVRWGRLDESSQVFVLVKTAVNLAPDAAVFPDPKKVYELKEFTKGERVAVGSAGNVLRWQVTNDKDQKFRFVDRGNGKWAIQSLRNNKFVAVGALGRLSVADEKKGEAAQEFRVVKMHERKFNLLVSTKDEYVSVGKTGEVLRWTKSNEDDQVFEWIEVKDEFAEGTVKDGWKIISSKDDPTGTHEREIVRKYIGKPIRLTLKSSSVKDDKEFGGKAAMLNLDDSRSEGITDRREVFFGDSSGAVKNRVSLNITGSVTFRDKDVIVLVGDNSEFHNLLYKGPRATNSMHAVGPFLENLELQLKGPTSGWSTQAGPDVANKDAGYSHSREINASLSLGFDGKTPSGSGSAGWSQSKESSTTVKDIEYKRRSDTNSQPIFTWSLGNVYDGDTKAIAYESTPWNIIHRTAGQIDIKRSVQNAPELSQGNFILVAYSSYTKTRDDVLDTDFKATLKYRVTYRTVQTDNVKGNDAELFFKGFGTVFGLNPDMYSGQAFRSWWTLKVVNEFDVEVTIPKALLKQAK